MRRLRGLFELELPAQKATAFGDEDAPDGSRTGGWTFRSLRTDGSHPRDA